MPVQAMAISTYEPDTGRGASATHRYPTWENVRAELLTMEPYSKPLITLEQDDDPAINSMMICGGNGIYHVQYADNNACWFEAYDPDGSDEEIAVWTSDQGFLSTRKSTWPLEVALTLAKYYFDNGCHHPDFCWH
jgi:hypothetical protein